MLLVLFTYLQHQTGFEQHEWTITRGCYQHTISGPPVTSRGQVIQTRAHIIYPTEDEVTHVLQ